MTLEEQKPFYNIDDVIHNKKTNPAILDWLANKFNVGEYKHSFPDQFMHWSIWDGKFTIRLDFRNAEQKALFDAIPDSYKGTPQKYTGIIVNKDTLYFDMDTEFKINYPKITRKKIIHTQKHKDNDGDTFYVYTWQVYFDDDSSILFSNQDKDTLDIENYILPTYIQERHIYHELILKDNGKGKN